MMATMTTDRESLEGERKTLLEKLYGMTRRQRGADKIAARIREIDLALGEEWQFDVRKNYPKAGR